MVVVAAEVKEDMGFQGFESVRVKLETALASATVCKSKTVIRRSSTRNDRSVLLQK